MKKVIYVIGVALIFVIGLMVYFEFEERNSSYSTPEEALKNKEYLSYEIIDIIETRILKENNYAYVFYYSQRNEPYDYFVISEFEEGKYGWKFVSLLGGGLINQSNANGSTRIGGVEDGEYYGLATSEVSTVKLGLREAELIPLNVKDMKIWIFYNPSPEVIKNELEFYDNNGKLLNH
jgi:hypothetical protein